MGHHAKAACPVAVVASALLLLVLSAQAQVTLVTAPRIQFLDTSGNPLAAGLVDTWISGTTTPQATYTDSTGGTANANPVELDSGGFAAIWLTPGEVYTIVLKNSSGVQQWSVDGVTSGLLDTTSLVVGTTAVTFTSTPTFNSATSTYFSITLTGNVTSSTISNASDGRIIYFNICQDSTGGRTFTWPATVLRPSQITLIASACTNVQFLYDGTNWRQVAASGDSSTFNSIQNDGVLIIPEDGNACSFLTLTGVNWQICSNLDTLQVEHFNSGGVGRFQVNADFMVGPPGSATVSENFNSFAWDNEGSYWDGSQARFNLWEMAVGTTPDSGTPINSRFNMWPLFTGACAGCTADIAFGASGTNPVRGNPSGTPMWIFNILPRDGFSVTFAHSGFTSNRTFTFPDATGTLALINPMVVDGSITSGALANPDTLTIQAVDSIVPGASGSSLLLNAGDGDSDPTLGGIGGDVILTSGDGQTVGNRRGGDVVLDPGAGVGSARNGRVSIENGVNEDGGGFKHTRIASGTTAASLHATASATWTFSTAFSDTSYTITCTVDNPTGVPIVANTNSKAAGSINIVIMAGSAAAASGTLNCMAVHD